MFILISFVPNSFALNPVLVYQFTSGVCNGGTATNLASGSTCGNLIETLNLHYSRSVTSGNIIAILVSFIEQHNPGFPCTSGCGASFGVTTIPTDTLGTVLTKYDLLTQTGASAISTAIYAGKLSSSGSDNFSVGITNGFNNAGAGYLGLTVISIVEITGATAISTLNYTCSSSCGTSPSLNTTITYQAGDAILNTVAYNIFSASGVPTFPPIEATRFADLTNGSCISFGTNCASYHPNATASGSTNIQYANFGGTTAYGYSLAEIDLTDLISQTQTITGFLVPNFVNGVNSFSWLYFLIVVFVPMGEIIGLITAESRAVLDRHSIIFVFLGLLLLDSIFGVMLNVVTVAMPFIFGLLFGIYLWRGKG